MNNSQTAANPSEAAAWSDDSQKFSFNIRDFLDEFHADPRAERLLEDLPFAAKLSCDNGSRTRTLPRSPRTSPGSLLAPSFLVPRTR